MADADMDPTGRPLSNVSPDVGIIDATVNREEAQGGKEDDSWTNELFEGDYPQELLEDSSSNVLGGDGTSDGRQEEDRIDHDTGSSGRLGQAPEVRGTAVEQTHAASGLGERVPSTALGRGIKNLLDWQKEGPQKVPPSNVQAQTAQASGDESIHKRPAAPSTDIPSEDTVSKHPGVGDKTQTTGDPSGINNHKRRTSATDGDEPSNCSQGTSKRARSAAHSTIEHSSPPDTDEAKARPDGNDGNAHKLDKEDTFTQTWKTFIENARANDAARSNLYYSLHQRALSIYEKDGKLILPPVTSDMPIDELFQETRRTIITAELPFAKAAWRARLALLLAQGRRELHKWTELMFAGFEARSDGSHTPTMPPALPDAAEEPRRPSSPVTALPDYAKLASDLGFDGQRASIEGHWNFKTTLGKTLKRGEGMDGHVGLWVKSDSNGNVINTTVAKETYVGTMMPRISWDSSMIWYGDVKNELPREAMAHRLISEVPRPTNVVRYLASATYLDRKMYRIYMEHCLHGDLEDVIREYAARNRMRNENGNEVKLRIPETVLWGIFESLVNVLCLLERGALPLPRAKVRPRNWMPMLHRDFKPENVFLSTPNDRLWPCMPTVKLGDFGFAIHANDKYRQNPKQMLGVGTDQYMAPEQRFYDQETTDKLPFIKNPLLSAADVYAVGRIMVSLMDLIECADNVLATFADGTDVKISLSQAARKFYSPKLQQYVLSCCKQLPNQRLGVELLWKQIRAETETFDVDGDDQARRVRKLGPDEHFFYKDADIYAKLAR